MAKVTVIDPADMPSQQIIAASRAEETVKDALGRSITVRKLAPFDRMRMSKVVGAENSTNQSYMVYALVAYSLKQIDGEVVIPPRTESELEMLVKQLGEEGYQAALDAVVAFYADTAGTDLDAVKN